MSDYGAELARELSESTYDKAGAFMLSSASAARAEALGFPDVVGFYLAGRLGAIGDAVPQTAAAAHGFLNQDLAAQVWPTLGQVVPREQAAQAFADVCAEYARAHLAEFDEGDARRLVELAERVVDAVPPTPLFAAWRAMPRPSDARQRAAHLLNLLREWRGGVHVAAVATQGLTPVEAIMSDGGAFYAEAFGWPQPWPQADGRADEIAAVRANVDRACGRFLSDALSRAEIRELADLAEAACARL